MRLFLPIGTGAEEGQATARIWKKREVKEISRENDLQQRVDIAKLAVEEI